MIVFVALLANLLICAVSFPFTEIPQGHLKGQFLKSANNRTFSSFTGIPYAEPPVGELRFELPRPAKKWNGTLDATKSHSICPQIDLNVVGAEVEGTEDCLYLNVYTPALELSNLTRLLPVMIYIHGGGFSVGNANRFKSNPKFLLDKDIVLVAPNYRLGPLGFLSTGDEVVPGNNALKDQSLAIKWVKQNIVYFGGDPDKITLFGQSAGGASTHFHMLSPMSKDLIGGVISQSGTALNSWATAPNGRAITNAKKLALSLNCSIASTKHMVECLKEADAADITKKQHSFYDWELDPAIPFRPVIEPDLPNAFLSESPADIIKSGNAAKIPFLTGIVTEDGALRSPSIFANPRLLKELNEDFDWLAPIVFHYGDVSSNTKDITRRIKEFYFTNETITNTSRSELTNVFTDSWFLSGANKAVLLHMNYTDQPIYYYLFGHRGTFSYSSLIDDSFDYGVAHSDDLLYLFSYKDVFPGYEPSVQDLNVVKILTTLWTNFAIYGNPTPNSNPIGDEKWRPVESTNLEYYSIKNITYMDDKLYWNRTQFWKNLPFWDV